MSFGVMDFIPGAARRGGAGPVTSHCLRSRVKCNMMTTDTYPR